MVGGQARRAGSINLSSRNCERTKVAESLRDSATLLAFHRLKEEPEFGAPPSDGHMIGLAIIILREAGVPAGDARLQKGVEWLKSNQRASGRWWTRSLNTDAWHFITYSGTAFRCWHCKCATLCR